MSREGAYRNIDNIVSQGSGFTSTERYHRTALGNAVRYSTMLTLLSESQDFTTRESFSSALESKIREQVDEYNDAINPENDDLADRTVQGRLQSATFRTALGKTVARETAFNAARSFSAGERASRFGTSNTANSFFNSFFQDPEVGDADFFGSKVLYDNVFGPAYSQDGTTNLSMRDHLIDNPDTDAGVTASQKVLRGIVKSSMVDAESAIDRLDLEFTRFMGESQLNAASMTGSGLDSARNTLRRVQLNGIARERNNMARSSDYDPTQTPNVTSFTHGDEFDPAKKLVGEALEELKVRYQNRSSPNHGTEVANKAGVKSFVELFNSAENRISIQTYQFQNDTISAALSDVIKRRVMERGLDSTQNNPFVVDFTVAYPRNRDNQLVHGNVNAVGATSFSILGPNLIEAMKLEELKAQLQDFLVNEMGLAGANIDDYLQLNVQFRDRRFHPKVYLTDTMAAIGSQNLTGPVGNSINQAGSNFEQMFIVREKFKDRNNKALITDYKGSTRPQQTSASNVTARNADIRSSLLYRQIVNMSDAERYYAEQGNEGYGLMHNRGQVGLSGDIYQHLKQTLDFTYEYYHGQSGKSSNAPGSQEVVRNGGKFHMFFVLDQAFMLQYGDTAFMGDRGTGKFEMGDEYAANVYGEKDKRREAYRELQGRLMNLLISNRAHVTVDPKNYKGQVYDPLANKIMALDNDNPLKKRFLKSGKNLGLLAGNALFGPRTIEEHDKSVSAMKNFMRMQGLTVEAGFTDKDLIQIMAMGSGNIKMSSAPRQHIKTAGLMEYDQTTGQPTLKSLVASSSNMGMYSLGIPSGGYVDGRPIYHANDFKSVNTEMGLLLGTDVSREGETVSLSRRDRPTVSPQSTGIMEYSPTGGDPTIGNTQEEATLSYEMERDELYHLQHRFIATHSQLGNNRITHPGMLNVRNTPLWMDNVNSGGLFTLKARLEAMRSDMGISESAFKIQERLAEDGSIKSFNVTIDMSKVLGQKGFLDASAALPKLNFELSVLNGPNRGADFAADRTQGVPGFVYFVDKNKVVGNGLFVNGTTTSIDLLGRKNYGDDFVRGVSEVQDPTSGYTRKTLQDGYITLGAGESAHLSSLDLVPQMFGTLIAEGMHRMAVHSPQHRWRQLEHSGKQVLAMEEFMAKAIFGTGRYISHEETRVIEGPDGPRTVRFARDTTAQQLLTDNLGYLSSQEFVGKMSVALFGKDTSASVLRKLQEGHTDAGLTSSQRLTAKERAFADLARTFNLYGMENSPYSKEQILDQVLGKLQNLIAVAPELVNEVLKYGDVDGQISRDLEDFKQYQSTLFDPFLQSREVRAYGGQQGFYKTHLLGLAGNTGDERTLQMMQALDPSSGIQNLRAFNRFQALNYNPLTDVYEYMYRSIASKSTSMVSHNEPADSLLFEQEARSMGDAANMRLMGSIGVGTELDVKAYLTVDSDGKLTASKRLTDMAMEMTGIYNAQDVVLQAKLNQLVDIYKTKFKARSEKVGDTYNLVADAEKVMQFYTGSKIAQLPQRIKNAMGAKPMWQYGLEAQRAIEGTFSEKETDVNKKTIQGLTQTYLTKQQGILDRLVKTKLATILSNSKGNPGTVLPDDVTMAMSRSQGLDDNDLDLINRLQQAQNDMFRTSTYGLGAIFKGRIKTILSEEQADFVSKKRQELEDLFGTEDQAAINEFLRVEVIKESIYGTGLGKMVAGSDQMRFQISLLQLNGTYTDTFLANPLFGTVYRDKGTYDNLLSEGGMGAGITDHLIKTGEVLNRGMREGYIEMQARSIKASMIGEGGMRTLMKTGDRIVEVDGNGDAVINTQGKGTGRFMLQRFNNKTQKWEVVRTESTYIVEGIDGEILRIPESQMQGGFQGKILAIQEGTAEVVDEKRNSRNIANVVDNTSFSTRGSSSVGAVQTTNYGRVGSDSHDMIYDQEFRAGNFDNNEYLQILTRLRGQKPNGGHRVEGTDSHVLAKGVANFAGQVQYNLEGKYPVEMGYFQMMEAQMLEKNDEGIFERVGGSMAYVAQNLETLGTGDKGYTALSSMIHGMYNSNNFKSFFWSHGAKILTEFDPVGDTTQKDFFLLKNVFNKHSKQESNLQLAQKMLGGLIMAFGDEFIVQSEINKTILDPTTGKSRKHTAIQRALVEGMQTGKYGETYRSLANAQLLLTSQEAVNESDLYSLVYKKIKQKSVFEGSDAGALNLAGLQIGFNEAEVLSILKGTATDTDVEKILGKVKTLVGLEADGTSKYGKDGFLTLHGEEGMMNRQAAAVVTAIDLFQQMSAQNKRYNIPADIDMSDERVRQIMMTVGGLGGSLSEEELEIYGAAIEGVSSIINAVGIFTDITFSLSKDPTGTQSVGRHEAQHLVSPFLGQIKEYQEGGQLHKIQHTMASLMALSAGTKTGSMYWGKLNRKFTQARAMSLRDQRSDMLFSPWEAQKFLGFYHGGHLELNTTDLVKEYKDISREIATVKDTDMTGSAFESKVEEYVTKKLGYKGDRAQAEIMRLQSSGYYNFQDERLRRVEGELGRINDSVQANPDTIVGKTDEFLKGMSNKTMFFAMPMINFDRQNGQLVARLGTEDVYTFLPAAAMMRDLGAQHQDFIDPIMQNYKTLATLFTPGHIASNALQKVLRHGQDSSGVILTSEEQKALQQAMFAATSMLPSIEEAIASKRTQEIFAGSHKYQGFTATGIGSMLVPLGSAVLSQSKLNEVQGDGNVKRLAAFRAYSKKVSNPAEQAKHKSIGPLNELEKALVLLDESLVVNGDQYERKNGLGISDVTSAVLDLMGINETEGKLKADSTEKKLQSTMSRMRNRKSLMIILSKEGAPKALQSEMMYGLLRDFDLAYDHMNRLTNDDSVTNVQSLKKMMQEMKSMKASVLEVAASELGFIHQAPMLNEIGGTSSIKYRRKRDITKISEQEKERVFGESVRWKDNLKQKGGSGYLIQWINKDGKTKSKEIRIGKGKDDFATRELALEEARSFVMNANDEVFNGIEQKNWERNYKDKEKLERIKYMAVMHNPMFEGLVSGKQQVTDLRTEIHRKAEMHNQHLQVTVDTQVEPTTQRLVGIDYFDPVEETSRVAASVVSSAARKYYKGDSFDEYTDPTISGPEGRTKGKYTKLEVQDLQRINNFYKAGKAVLVEGMEEPARKTLMSLQSRSLELTNQYEKFVLNVYDFEQSKDDPNAKRLISETYGKIRQSLRKERERYKQLADSAQDDGTKYVYTLAELNVRAVENKILLRYTTSVRRDKLSEAVKEKLERRRSRFEQVEAIFNIRSGRNDGKNIFTGLGSFAAVEQEALHASDVNGKLNGVMQANGLKSSNGSLKIMDHLKDIDKMPDKGTGFEGDKEGFGAFKREQKAHAAKNQLDVLIQNYKQQRNALDGMDVVRNVGATGSEEQKRRARAIAEEVHKETIAETNKLIEELTKYQSTITSETKNSAYESMFNTVNDLIIEHDRQNRATIEFFRSPTPGGTDLRLHTLRAMEGVSALNNAIQVINKTSHDTAPDKITFDVSRNTTATYAAAVGIVTYGGGDWDGDPYTVIFNKAGDFAERVSNKRRQFEMQELQLKAMLGNYSSYEDAKANKAGNLDALRKQQKAVADAKDRYLRDEGKYKAWLKAGSQDLEGRARKQVANFLGIDERYFISVDGTEEITDLYLDEEEMSFGKQTVRGFASQTYNADQLHALLNTGYGLFEGVENAGTKILQLNRNVSALTGLKKTRLRNGQGGYRNIGQGKHQQELVDSSRNALEFLTNLEKGFVPGQKTTVDFSGDAEALARSRANMMYDHIENMIGQTAADSSERAFLQGIIDRVEERSNNNKISRGNDAELQGLAGLMMDLKTEIETKTGVTTQQMVSQGNMDEKIAQSVEYSNAWIGGHLWNSITGSKAMQKQMGLAVGDAVDGSMFNLLSQTLGKAGGEILGKTYNTIIGSTFKDAPVIGLGRLLSDQESTFYQTTETALIKAQIVEDGNFPGIDNINKVTSEHIKQYKNSEQYDSERMLTFARNAQVATTKSERMQGFMKNVHQILRDSIKLKGDAKSQIEQLKSAAGQYETLSEQIGGLDPDDKDGRRDLMDQRNKIINELASGLGPGAGLKALVGMDRLIKTASKGGITKTEFANHYMEGGVNNAAFKRVAGELRALGTREEAAGGSVSAGITQDQYNELMNLKPVSGEDTASSALRKVAEYQVQRGIVSMVTSYRFDNAIAQNGGGQLSDLSVVREFATSHKTRLVEEQLRTNPAVDYNNLSDTERNYYNTQLKGIKSSHIAGISPANTPTNVAADAHIRRAEESVDRLLTNRYMGGDVNRLEGSNQIEDSAYRSALAMHLNLQYDDMYDNQGRITDKGRTSIQSAATDNDVLMEDYLLRFDATYRHAYETQTEMFGTHGEKLGALASAEELRVNLSVALSSGDESGVERVVAAQNAKARALGDAMLNNMDNEMMTTMAQLMTQNKLGIEGMDIMNKVYSGVMSAMLERSSATFTVNKYEKTTDADGNEIYKLNENNERIVADTQTITFSEMNDAQRKRVTTRNVLEALLVNDPQTMNRATNAEATKNANEIRALINNDAWLDEYLERTEGTLGKEHLNAISAITEEMIVKTTENDDLYDKYLDTMLPKGELQGVPKEQMKNNMKEFVEQKRQIRRLEYAEQQMKLREQYMDDNAVFKRTSMMGQLDGTAASLLAKNKVSTGLDILMPIGLTVIGQAISEGSVTRDDIQAMGGATLTAFSYARAGMIDTEDYKNSFKARGAQMQAQAMTSIYKFRNALNTYDGDYGMAFTDGLVRETVAMSMNKLIMDNAKAGDFLTEKVFGAAPTSSAMRTIDMDRYNATRQLAGNVGASLISAVSSTLITGLLMKNVVQPGMQQAAQAIQNFQPAADYVSANNAQIARQRAQEQAYETLITAETDGAEQEITAYNVVTSSTYSEYDQGSREDLMAVDVLEVDSLGNMSVNFYS